MLRFVAPLTLALGLICLQRAQSDCTASDAHLLLQQQTVCASIGGCPVGNVTAEGDWPNQVIYMGNVLRALVSPATCLNTTVAKTTVAWLDDTDLNTPWWNTWSVFQVQWFYQP
jgi:hypothetical protein